MSDYPNHDTQAEAASIHELRHEEMAQMLDELLSKQGPTSADLDDVLTGLLDEIDAKLADVNATLDRIGAA